MSTTQEQWRQAFVLLNQFERQLIEPEQFCWTYFTTQVGVSKATLWRNRAFEQEFQRVRSLVKAYAQGKQVFDQATSIQAAKERDKDRQIETLKAQVAQLTLQLARERERLVYAALVARRKNIDPAEFIEQCPLRR